MWHSVIQSKFHFNKSHASHQKSIAGWGICKMVCLRKNSCPILCLHPSSCLHPLCWNYLNVSNSSNFRFLLRLAAEWLLDCRFHIVYERRPDHQCFTFSRNQFLGSCLSSQLATQKRFHIACGSTRGPLSALHSIQETGGGGDGRRWWYISTWALTRSWSRERGEKKRRLLSFLFKTTI